MIAGALLAGLFLLKNFGRLSGTSRLFRGESDKINANRRDSNAIPWGKNPARLGRLFPGTVEFRRTIS